MQHAGKVVTSQDRQKPERVGEIAAKAVVQPARKAAGGSRGTASCGVAQQRGVNHRACNRQLGLVGLQLRILNGVVSLLTTEVHNKALAQYLIQQSGAIGSLDLTTATLEVLACIAFKATPNLFGVRPLFAQAVMHYNFCRIHQSLRVTHATESGVADHVGSPEEVVAILVDRR